jgi:hypothetical protein
VHHYFKYDDLMRSTNSSEVDIEAARQEVITIFNRMDKSLPQEVIPIASKELAFQFGYIYGKIGYPEKLRSILDDLYVRSDITVNDKLRYGQSYAQELNDREAAVQIFEELYTTFLTLENAINARGLKNTRIDQATWNQWQQVYPEIVSSLVLTNRSLKRLDRVETILTDWLERNPEDVSAERLLNEVRTEKSAVDSG